MIQYQKGAFGWNLLFRLHGSAIYRAFFPGFLSIAFFLLIRLWLREQEDDQERDLGHPYAVGVLVGSVSFLIVFRANHGYSRYWEATGAIHQMMSKWMDATVHTMVFHMQCDHYQAIKPPCFFDHPELNHAFLTRNRERKPTDSSSRIELGEQKIRRSMQKSINAVSTDSTRKVPFPRLESVYGEDEPQPLRGEPRLDGGWQGFFRQSPSTATFYDPEEPWNADGKGFASTIGGQTPPLFLQELAHLSSLLSAVALSTLRNDIEGAQSPLDIYEAGNPWPEVDPAQSSDVESSWAEIFKSLTGADRTPEARTKYNAARPLSVLGGVSDSEIKFLQMARGPHAKTQLCWIWLSEFITREHLAGSTGKVGPPIISRIIQFLGDGMIFYNHARKVMFIPFPFVHAQLSAFFVVAIVFAVPFLMDQYAQEAWVGGILTFLTVTCLAGLHEVARELENPFRNVPNDLPLCTIQAFYNEALITMYSGYHPDFYWNTSSLLDSADGNSAKTESSTVPSTPVDVETTTDDISSEGTPDESQLSQLQLLIEEQGREIEKLRKQMDLTNEPDCGKR